MSAIDTCNIAFLDVGQGDSIVVLLPEEGQALVIDCPKARAPMVYKFLQQHRITEIPLAVVTHAHRDHAGHFLQLLENFRRGGGRVSRVACIPQLDSQPDKWPENRQLLAGIYELERQHSIEILPGYFQYLDADFFGVSVQALYPTVGEAAGAFARQKPNEASVVLKVGYKGYTVLLTADLAGPGMEVIGSRGAKDVDVLQVPHHGGWDERFPAFVKNASPKYAIVSVGSENEYGHPSHKTVSALREISVKIACTQATPQCHQDLGGLREAVISSLPESSQQRYRSDTRASCPCAGTVLVEMTASGIKISPEVSGHDAIVTMMPSALCRRGL